MKRIFIYLLLNLFLVTMVRSQGLDFLRTELTKHVYTLASDSLEGRATGTMGQRKAANYIEKEFISNELSYLNKDSYRHYYNLLRKHKNSVMVESNKNLLFSPWHFHFVSGFNQTDTIQTNLIYCGFATDVELESLAIENKAIAFSSESPQVAYERIKEIRAKYSITNYFVLLPKGNNELDKAWETNYLISEFALEDKFNKAYELAVTEEWNKPIDSINVFYCFPNVLRKVFNRSDSELVALASNQQSLNEIDVQSLELQINSNDSIEQVEVENVGAIVYGKNRDQFIVVSAHYDHLGVDLNDIFYGADDNASGTAVLLELSRLFGELKHQGIELERSIMFLAFSGEEMGLYGSKAYVDNPVISLDSTILNINMDMVGRWDSKHEEKRDFVYFLNAGKGYKKYFKLAKRKIDVPKGFVVSNRPGSVEKKVFTVGSDHHNFMQNKVPISVVFTGLHDDYHTPADTPDKINFGNMSNITQLLYKYIYEIANNPEDYPLRFKR